MVSPASTAGPKRALLALQRSDLLIFHSRFVFVCVFPVLNVGFYFQAALHLKQ